MRVAAIQPRTHVGPDAARNVDDAVAVIARAADAGADLVVFPEGYPGPTNPADLYDGLGPLQAAAAEHRVHVVAGHLTATDGDKHMVSVSLIDDEGRVLTRYDRTSPPGPYIYQDIPEWNFDYQESHAVPAVIDTRIGRIGLLVCSELYVPELSRLLALRGAQVICYPAGGAINELLDGWRTLVRARAIENLVYTVAVQNLYADGEQGVGTIAAPERVLESRADAGMLLADLDLSRLDYLRSEQEHIVFPKPYATIPGVLDWRRPELYAELADVAEGGGR
ncbi:MAG: Nitrilase/cyanide hydratase and apolipoprotein N-acyltransferase [Blastococcus sp.]|jgi:predicted amidohydrolase|nr:Nitrilase/cyanide hydratase and apolipoprotein N-acyltransferase [Blastococcus sp.]